MQRTGLKITFFIVTVFLWVAPSAIAATPVPAHKINGIDELQKKLSSQQAAQAQLQGQLKDAGKDLDDTKSQLVKTAQSVRETEQTVNGLQIKIKDLTQQETTLQKELSTAYGSMGDLVLALVRLRRVPPELLIIRPGAPLQTAQTGTLLGSILPALNKRTNTLNATLKQLNDVHQALQHNQAQAQNAKIALDQKYAAINVLAQKRTALYQKLNSDAVSNAAEIDRISKQAHNMQDLMEKLAAEQARAAKIASVKAQPTASEDKQRHGASYVWSLPKVGRPQLPVAGTILINYGEHDEIGATAQGITVQAASRALVVAPMGGVVRFSGPFKSYNHLVILEHDGGYVSLIAGLDTVNAAIGQSLDAGEPVGKLPEVASPGGKPTLYYELRFKGRPINPSDKFPDLKVKS